MAKRRHRVVNVSSLLAVVWFILVACVMMGAPFAGVRLAHITPVYRLKTVPVFAYMIRAKRIKFRRLEMSDLNLSAVVGTTPADYVKTAVPFAGVMIPTVKPLRFLQTDDSNPLVAVWFILVDFSKTAEQFAGEPMTSGRQIPRRKSISG